MIIWGICIGRTISGSVETSVLRLRRRKLHCDGVDLCCHMLIFLFLVSNLILVYNLIVASRSYVEKLAHVVQSSLFKHCTVLALK